MDGKDTDKGYLIKDIIGYYRYTAESPAEAWAYHVTNINSFNNSFLSRGKKNKNE